MEVQENDIKCALLVERGSEIGKLLQFEFDKKIKNQYNFTCFFPSISRNSIGFVQCGFITAALDHASSFTLAMVGHATNSRELVTSTDMHITFHQSVALGRSRIKIKLLKLNQSKVSIQAQVFSSNKLSATMLHTALRLEKNSMISV